MDQVWFQITCWIFSACIPKDVGRLCFHRCFSIHKKEGVLEPLVLGPFCWYPASCPKSFSGGPAASCPRSFLGVTLASSPRSFLGEGTDCWVPQCMVIGSFWKEGRVPLHTMGYPLGRDLLWSTAQTARLLRSRRGLSCFWRVNCFYLSWPWKSWSRVCSCLQAVTSS